MAGNLNQHCISDDEAHLGALAMSFRGTRVKDERESIAKEYAKTVKKLVKSRCWKEMPPPEDQLPDEYMPREFFQYWSQGRGSPLA
jgi:hypothetical protein